MKHLAISCVLLAGLSAALPAQEPSPPAAQPEVFRSGASLVSLTVTVVGPDKRLITGLNARDFAVFEDGVAQEVRFFESTAVPIDLILLIDTSSSMSDKIDLVQKAGLGVIQTLRPQDRGAIVSFSDGVNIVQTLTSDVPALEDAMKRTRGKGGTALHNAVYIALKEFGRVARQASDVRRQAIAVLSDGEDTASLIGFDEVMLTAQKSGISIYPISLQSETAASRTAAIAGGRRNVSDAAYSLRKLAQETGAVAFFPQHVSELTQVYTTITRELASQYSIGYTPTNPRADGRYRRIEVKVPSHPELSPRARGGYIAQTPAPRAAVGNEQAR